MKAEKTDRLKAAADREIDAVVADFEGDIARASRLDRHHGWMIFSLGMVALLAALVVWAKFAQIEQVASGEALVIPSSREQVLQSLEGGILGELLVREGDTVEKGQVVARIDPTRAEASFKEGENRVAALRAQSARLRAESLDLPLTFPKDVLANKELVDIERANYEARRKGLDESVKAFTRARELTLQELALAQPMVAKGLMSQTEVIRLKRQANEAELQIVDRRNRYRSDASNELAKVDADLSALNETVIARKDQFERTDMRSSVRGVVKAIHVNTLGGVIAPGATLMDITPLEDTLLVEARIKPADVAFLKPGLHAVVKISAYDFSVYGGLNGTVEYISPGALKDEDKRTMPGMEPTYYRVTIRTEGNTLTKAGSLQLKIIPGMTGTVDILTGKKSVFDYLLKPMLRVQEAFREP
jgi:adhesin transport system membrane fusion protein